MGRGIHIRKLTYGAVSFWLAAAPFAAAQAQAELKPFVNAYKVEYFSGSHPSSAFEMVGLLPGFQLVEGDPKVRGYGGAIGNVLIDGRPPTSKQETMEVILRRITPDSIERIEIVRSGAAGFDFQGYPLLANVVLKPNNAPRGQVSLEDAQYRHGCSSRAAVARMTWGSTHVLDATFTASRKTPDTGAGYGVRNNIKPDGTVIRLDRYSIMRNDNVWNLTGGYRQPLLGGALRLTGLYNEQRSFAPLLDEQIFPVHTIAPGGDTEFKDDSEAGIQYNHPLWTGGELETALLRRAESDHKFQTAYVGTALAVSATHAHTSETILHTVLRQQGHGISFESGLDATLNTLENALDLAKDKVNVPLPAANVRIVEQRGEGYANVTWAATPALTVEPGVRYEMSRMKQRGDSVLTRQFSYLKPRVKASYRLNPDDVLRLLIEREAGQLNFNNFITTIDVKSNSVNGGNKNLVPQTLWRLELNWEHSFKGGSVVLTGRHELISNTQDHIAIRGAIGDIDSLGNIGGARNDEFQASVVWPMTWAPLSGLTIQANGLYRFSSVTDPQTFRRRGISGNLPWEGKIALTQDVPRWHVRLGASYAWIRASNAWRFDEYQINAIHLPQTEVFVEYKPAPTWLLRLYGKNLLDERNVRERHIFFGNRGTTVENYLEDRRWTYGPQVGIYAQYSFGQ